MQDLFDTDKKRNKAIAQLHRLRESEDWKVLADVLEANIKVLETRIIAGVGEKEEIDRLRDRLSAYKDIRETPDTLLRRLTEEDIEPPRADPYHTAEDLTGGPGGANLNPYIPL